MKYNKLILFLIFSVLSSLAFSQQRQQTSAQTQSSGAQNYKIICESMEYKLTEKEANDLDNLECRNSAFFPRLNSAIIKQMNHTEPKGSFSTVVNEKGTILYKARYEAQISVQKYKEFEKRNALLGLIKSDYINSYAEVGSAIEMSFLETEPAYSAGVFVNLGFVIMKKFVLEASIGYLSTFYNPSGYLLLNNSFYAIDSEVYANQSGILEVGVAFKYRFFGSENLFDMSLGLGYKSKRQFGKQQVTKLDTSAGQIYTIKSLTDSVVSIPLDTYFRISHVLINLGVDIDIAISSLYLHDDQGYVYKKGKMSLDTDIKIGFGGIF